MRPSTETLIADMRILAAEIQSPDGVANAAIREAADRLAELAEAIDALRKADDERTHQLRQLSARYTGRPFTEELDEILEAK
jgi:hypothetical protein